MTDHVCIVIAATGGVGQALGRRLHQSGASLHLSARDDGKLLSLLQSLNTKPLWWNATNSERVNEALQTVQSYADKLDSLTHQQSEQKHALNQMGAPQASHFGPGLAVNH